MGQTNLALLVALVSVSTILLSAGLPLLKPASSDIEILFEAMSDTEASFIVRNTGRSGGILHIEGFVAQPVEDETINKFLPVTPTLDMLPNSTFVESGREQRISVGENTHEKSAKDKVCEGLQKHIEEVATDHPRFHGSAWLSAYMADLKCYFVIKETSFKMTGDGIRSLIVSCQNVKLVRSCIGYD